MRFSLGVGSKAKRLFYRSPAKEKPQNRANPVAELDFKNKPLNFGFGFKSPGLGSKEETFFDSQAWLESDCEADFLSVNGEFTPSQCSTPNYQTSTPAIPQLNKAFFLDSYTDSKSEPSPTDGKKKLADLLQETMQGELVGSKQNAINGKVETLGKPGVYKPNTEQPLESLNGTPYLSEANSACSNEVTPNRDSKPRKEKSGKTMQCCLPSLMHSLSFNERKRQKMSPGRGKG